VALGGVVLAVVSLVPWIGTSVVVLVAAIARRRDAHLQIRAHGGGYRLDEGEGAARVAGAFDHRAHQIERDEATAHAAAMVVVAGQLSCQ
jgi:hypothetical protein